MRRCALVTACVAMAVIGSREAYAEPKISGAHAPMVALESMDGWSVGLRGQVDRRELVSGGELVDLDISHWLGRLGYQVLPSLHVAAEAGVSKAETTDGGEGERGLEWAVLAHAKVLEQVLRGSAVIPHKETVGLDVQASYRQSESNFDDADLDWSEWRVSPSIVYTLDRRGDVIFRPYNAEILAARAGLVYAGVDGDLGPDSLSENRDFGVSLTFDYLMHSGWVIQAHGVFFGSRDREIGLGFHHYF